MTDSVVDASVALKWLRTEEHSRQAEALAADAAGGRVTLLAPPLIVSEVLNALYQIERRGALAVAQADASLLRFLAAPVGLASPPDLPSRALAAARQFGLSATYDAQYLALAELLDVEFWTADERLLRSLHPRPPWVHWIGDYDA